MPHEYVDEHDDDGEASVLAMAASSMNRRKLRSSRRKISRAPSVASSSVSGFRLKGAFLVGRRGSPSTPVPRWKVHDEGPMPLDIRKQQRQHHHNDDDHHGHDHDHDHPHHHSSLPRVSARKLAASLWELQELPFSRGGPNCTRKGEHTHQPHMLPTMNNHASHGNMGTIPHARPFSPASSMGSHVRSSMRTQQRRHAGFMEKLRVHGGATKAEVRGAGATPRNSVLGIEAISTKLGSCGQITTNDLVKVLNHVRSLEERHARSVSLVGALRAELDQAHSQLQELLRKEKAHSKEGECVTKRMVEERALWQEQHEQSIRLTLLSISQELENERKSKQKLEVLHKRVTKELRDARRRIASVLQDLEKERKARELMEDVCDELAREIGEDKAIVEELRRESVKVREEVEEERKMLQMAEVWREERVQMKLMEAKLELEEKNMALDKLRSELEMFLKARRGTGVKEEVNLSQHTYRHSLGTNSGQSFADVSHSNEQKGLVMSRKSVDSVVSKQSALRVVGADDGSEGEDDLHSIELNNESYIMSGSTQCGQLSSQQHDYAYNGRNSVQQRSSTAHKYQRQMSGGLQGLERRRNNQVDIGGREEAGAEKDGHIDYSQVSQWIECSFEGGKMREWSVEQQEALQRGREESIKSWQNSNKSLHEHVSLSPKVMGGNANGQVGSFKPPLGATSVPLNDCKEGMFSRNQSDWLQRMFECRNAHSNSMLDDEHEGPKLTSSPTWQWNTHWSSGDPRSESSREITDDSSRTKLLDG